MEPWLGQQLASAFFGNKMQFQEAWKGKHLASKCRMVCNLCLLWSIFASFTDITQSQFLSNSPLILTCDTCITSHSHYKCWPWMTTTSSQNCMSSWKFLPYSVLVLSWWLDSRLVGWQACFFEDITIVDNSLRFSTCFPHLPHLNLGEIIRLLARDCRHQRWSFQTRLQVLNERMQLNEQQRYLTNSVTQTILRSMCRPAIQIRSLALFSTSSTSRKALISLQQPHISTKTGMTPAAALSILVYCVLIFDPRNASSHWLFSMPAPSCHTTFIKYSSNLMVFMNH